MSTFINNDITDAGRVLLARGHMGEPIKFTRLAMGDGFLPPDTSIREMTNLVNQVVSIPISRLRRNPDGTVIIGGTFSNADITEPFFYRELGLFAENVDGVESLYCYGNAGEFAERITPVGGGSVITKAIDIVTAIGTTTNITANIVAAGVAEEISFDDTRTLLGASNVQEAVEILARADNQRLPVIVISETEPTEPCEIWLKPAGGVEFDAPTIDGGGNEEPGGTPQELRFYLAHYYDRVRRRFFPFAYMNTAQNVLLNPGASETVADAITQLNGARIQILAELFAHASDASIHGEPGQLDNALMAIGELILHINDSTIHITAADRAHWSGGVLTAQEALLLAEESRNAAQQAENRLARLEDGLFNNITGNPFLISFDTLDGISLVRGVWNRERQRIEC